MNCNNAVLVTLEYEWVHLATLPFLQYASEGLEIRNFANGSTKF
jgi:hypothetical protein